ncbi:MAG: coenzyme F420-0:L-glutamate ligase [Jiangellaceae bacterium]
MSHYQVIGVTGIPEVAAGDDLAAVIAEATGDLRDGDIVVVTSKIVSKAEGRVVSGVSRDEVIDAETERVVAEWTTPRGRTRIAQTPHGFVLAAAGVDASNVAAGSVALLPVDPDATARALRRGLRERLGVDVGVVVTDTAGRPWRDGVVDFAVGAAGVVVRDDLRGRRDPYGNELDVTVVAVADELAAATELVRTKLAAVPVAVVRGLPHLVTPDDGPGAAVLVRPAAEDRFRLGTPEAMRAAVFARHTVREFTEEPVDGAAVRRAVAAALIAPSPPGHATPWRFVLVESEGSRVGLLDALDREGVAELPPWAPYLVVPCLAATDDKGQLLAMGASVENLLVALAADGLGSAWAMLHRTAADVMRSVLDLPADWLPMGIIAAGRPARPPSERTVGATDEFLLVR